MKKVLILRGISGAGKSTWIKNNHPNAIIASADKAFLKKDGTYNFDDTKLHDAHMACFQIFVQAVIQEKPLIIIDNGNVHVWEISPYVMPAQSFGYEVEIVTFDCLSETAIKRKNWVSPEKVKETEQLVKSEEDKFPEFMKKVHRRVDNN